MTDMAEPQPTTDNQISAEGLKVVGGTLGHLDRLDRLLTDLEQRAGILPSSDVAGGEDDEEEPPQTIPKVRECDWEHFVNHFDPSEPLCSIEVLVAGTKLRQDIAAEAGKRVSKLGMGPRPGRPSPYRVHRLENNTKWIKRVRIQSPALLAIFGKVTGYDWGTQPHTFMRPFPDLIYYHEKIKDELQRMESDENQASSNPAVLEDLRCYIDFAKRRLLPDFTRIREATELHRPRVLFSDLWYLFKPGDFVFVPAKSLLKAASEDMELDRIMKNQSLRESPWHQRKSLFNVNGPKLRGTH